MAAAEITIECGFCLRNDEELPNPKTLPCTHVHCLQCLTGYYMEYHMVMCPTQGCGEIVQRSPDTLPSYDTMGDDNCCDVCMDKKNEKQKAVMYCTVCSSKFCEKHLESHDDVLSKHKKMSMEEYKAQTAKLQIRTCAKHPSELYIMGCRFCLELGCVKCLTSMGQCDSAEHRELVRDDLGDDRRTPTLPATPTHHLMSLEDLVAVLMRDDISTKALAKEDQYEKLCKETSKVKADYDTKTTEFIQLIHQTRDAQLDERKLKYQKMEDELIKKRRKSSVALSEFMEEVVLKKWTQLMSCRKMVESRVQCSHQVDIVKGFKEIYKLVEEKLPKLRLTDELGLSKLYVKRAVELEVVSSCDIVIDWELNQAELKEVVLIKRSTGLGFTVVGGSDENCPMYVKKVIEKGAAASDGRLKTGDRIVSVNGTSLEGVTHAEAVSLLKSSKKTVVLMVMPVSNDTPLHTILKDSM